MMFWSNISIETLYLFDKNFLQDLRSPAREFPTPQPAYQLHEPWASHPQKLRTVLAVSNRSQISLGIFEKLVETCWNWAHKWVYCKTANSVTHLFSSRYLYVCTFVCVRCYEIFWGILDYWYRHDIEMYVWSQFCHSRFATFVQGAPSSSSSSGNVQAGQQRWIYQDLWERFFIEKNIYIIW